MSRKVGHLLRSKYNCIITSYKTINKDNALLNCRINGLNSNKPDLFIIDLNLRLKKGTSSPPFIVSSSPGTLIKDQDATIEVEMLSQPVISNANATFSFEPVVNLASNSTYIFNVTIILR